MKLSPYPEYKDSGVPWISTVPAHWNMLRNKVIFRHRRQIVGSSHVHYTLLSLTLRGIIKRDLENAKGKFPAEFDKYQVVSKGDFVFCLFDIDETPRTIGLSELDGMVTGAYNVFENKAPDAKYVYYYYLSIDERKLLKPLYTGLRKVIQEDRFLRAKLPQPLPSEQTQIARFLDWQTAQINKFIRNKLRLIALLKEQKQTIINEAVTGKCEIRMVKGEDGEERLQAFPTPPSKLRPSGVEWIGDIPEHWEVLIIRRCVKFVKTGGTPSGAGDECFSTPGFNWFTPGDFKDCFYLDCSERQLSEFGKTKVKVFPPNTVMMIGIGGTIGKVAISKKEASCNQQINGIVPNERVEVRYLLFVLRCLKDFIVSCGKFTTMPIINQDETKSLRISVPPVSEQVEIVEYINRKSNVIDQTITRAEREIELIREYRTRLISDVVTGQVDVRDVEVPEVAEDELAAFEAEMTEDDLSEDDVEQDDEGSEG